MEIRYITVSDDRLAISKVYEESWKYAYKGIILQNYLDSIPEGQWASHIEQAGRKNLVMVQDGIILSEKGLFCIWFWKIITQDFSEGFHKCLG